MAAKTANTSACFHTLASSLVQGKTVYHSVQRVDYGLVDQGSKTRDCADSSMGVRLHLCPAELAGNVFGAQAVLIMSRP
jgi:hypothetical protein